MFKKISIFLFVTFFALCAAAASTYDIDTYITVDMVNGQDTAMTYAGGEIRASFFETVRPFVAAGFSAGLHRDSLPDTSDLRYKSGINAYLWAIKGGVEYRITTNSTSRGDYQLGLSVYAVAHDYITDAYNKVKRHNEVMNEFSVGFGAEITASMPFSTRYRYSSSLASNAIIKVSCSYDINKAFDVGVLFGITFR